MIVVAGCLIVKDNKILMVKEGKKEIRGLWNLPAGGVDDNELISSAAIREVYEETGCVVKLKSVLPISTVVLKNGLNILRITFIAEMIEENIKIDYDEIIDVKWIEIDDIKNMTNKEIRGYDTILKTIDNYENGKEFSLEIFENNICYR